MKWFRRIALAVALLVAAAGLFYWFMPASVAVPLLAARTHGLVLGEVSGSLWDGRAARVATADGRELGSLNWQLGRGVILGRLRLDFRLEGRAGRVQGHVERGDGDRMTWTGFDFRLDAAALAGPALPAELVPMGSAGAKAMAILRGEADIYLHSGGQYEWDSCAPVAVALAHGLHCSRIDGSPLVYNQADVYMPDLLICRKEHAERVLAEVAALA